MQILFLFAVFAAAPFAEPIEPVAVLCDRDGDGMILDQEFAYATKQLPIMLKRKQIDEKLLDTNKDGKVDQLEITAALASARYHGDQITRNAVDILTQQLDKNGDGVASKQEIFAANLTENNFSGRIKFADRNGDGAVTIAEAIENADRVAFPDQRGQKHPSTRNRQLWFQAINVIKQHDTKKPGDNRVEKDEAKGKLLEKFGEIDADASGKISALELFNWMAVQ